VVGTCESGNEPSGSVNAGCRNEHLGSVNCGESHDWLRAFSL